MDRLLILLGLKKPPLPDTEPHFSPLPADDDINSKGLTQYFNLSLNKGGATASVINDHESGTSGTRSVADSTDENPYRDVNLRVHVRLLKKQNNMKVRLHVKVDPEETDNWLIPEKGKTNDLFFMGDEQIYPNRRRRSRPIRARAIESIKQESEYSMGSIREQDFSDDDMSAGYHSQTNSQSSIAEMSNIPELEMEPVVSEDDKFRFLMTELDQEKRDYDTTKLEICHFVYSKALKNSVSAEEVKAYPFNKICIILRDYFNSMGIHISNSGDLVFFEKRAKKVRAKKKKGMGSIDLLSQAHQSSQDAASDLDFSRKKKYCKEAIELYTELEERFINYRAYYYDAVDSYDVQIIESRFGYFMCEMQEELIMGNMILSGQVVPD